MGWRCRRNNPARDADLLVEPPMVRLCECGQPIYALMGRRCRQCGTERKAKRSAAPVKFPVPPRAPDPKRCPEHLKWVASLPCSVAGCRSSSVATHVRWNTGGGSSLKPADWWTIPLCHMHHTEQHGTTHYKFDRKHHLDSRAIAVRLAGASPYLSEINRLAEKGSASPQQPDASSPKPRSV